MVFRSSSTTFFFSLVTDSDVVLLVASMHDNAPDE